MLAAVYDQFGEPGDVLQVREVPTPKPASGEVLVKMLASPVNPSDLMTIRGVYGKLPKLPATPGYEGVGIVESAGLGLYGRMLVGKRVVVLNNEGGNWAEYVTLPAKQAVPISEKIPIAQAASFFVNPATAYLLVREAHRPAKGEWLLQTAAGSSLGRMIIRLGKYYGFKTINIVRRSEQVEELKRLGADVVIATDQADLKTEVLKITSSLKYAIDPVGGDLAGQVFECLGQRGKLIFYGSLSNAPSSFHSRQFLTRDNVVEGFWLSRLMQQRGIIGKIRLLRKVGSLITDGILETETGEAFPLTDTPAAVRKSEEIGRGGKVMIRIGTLPAPTTV